MANLTSVPQYMAFPLRIGAAGAAIAGRRRHIADQIKQVLYTNPGERPFRPDFGAGMRALAFEPNASTLHELTRRRLMASLADALKGEVDPQTLRVEVRGEDAALIAEVSYSLATIGQEERHEFKIPGGGGSG